MLSRARERQPHVKGRGKTLHIDLWLRRDTLTLFRIRKDTLTIVRAQEKHPPRYKGPKIPYNDLWPRAMQERHVI
jgi:hypothetical protein